MHLYILEPVLISFIHYLFIFPLNRPDTRKHRSQHSQRDKDQHDHIERSMFCIPLAEVKGDRQRIETVAVTEISRHNPVEQKRRCPGSIPGAEAPGIL